MVQQVRHLGLGQGARVLPEGVRAHWRWVEHCLHAKALGHVRWGHAPPHCWQVVHKEQVLVQAPASDVAVPQASGIPF